MIHRTTPELPPQSESERASEVGRSGRAVYRAVCRAGRRAPVDVAPSPAGVALGDGAAGAIPRAAEASEVVAIVAEANVDARVLASAEARSAKSAVAVTLPAAGKGLAAGVGIGKGGEEPLWTCATCRAMMGVVV